MLYIHLVHLVQLLWKRFLCNSVHLDVRTIYAIPGLRIYIFFFYHVNYLLCFPATNLHPVLCVTAPGTMMIILPLLIWLLLWFLSILLLLVYIYSVTLFWYICDLLFASLCLFSAWWRVFTTCNVAPTNALSIFSGTEWILCSSLNKVCVKHSELLECFPFLFLDMRNTLMGQGHPI